MKLINNTDIILEINVVKLINKFDYKLSKENYLWK